MAHHHASNQPRDEGKKFENIKIPSTVTTTPSLNRPSREVEKAKEVAPSNENRKSFLDYQIAGLAWPLVFVMSIIAIGVLGMILKVIGMF